MTANPLQWLQEVDECVAAWNSARGSVTGPTGDVGVIPNKIIQNRGVLVIRVRVLDEPEGALSGGTCVIGFSRGGEMRAAVKSPEAQWDLLDRHSPHAFVRGFTASMAVSDNRLVLDR